MQARRILCMILALALVFSAVAPCSSAFAAEETIYGENLEQVTAPVIGESYYLGADTSDGMVYFSHSSFTNTDPYALYTRTNFTHKWTVPMTLESPEALEEEHDSGFQLVYSYTKGDGTVVTNRVYCMDALQETEAQMGVLDTAAAGANEKAYLNRHNFFISEVGDLKLITNQTGLVLLTKKLLDSSTDKEEWRMLFASVDELANEGVYPVMLLQEHAHKFDRYVADLSGHKKSCWCGATAAETEAHTFGEVVISGNTVTRTCAVCDYAETVYDGKLVKADAAVIGNSYYLAANVDGTMRYFRHGTVTDTVPYSLVATTNFEHNWMVPVTLEDPSVLHENISKPGSHTTGFQMVYSYTDSEGKTSSARIYCMDSLTDKTLAGQTGIMDTGANSTEPYKNRHNFYIENVNGQKVLKKTGNDHILVMKKVPQTVSGETTDVWRILGVPESELANEGVYPVSLFVEHQHDFTSGKPQAAAAAHTETCWCGAVGEKTENHTYGAATTTGDVATRICTVCDYADMVYEHKTAVSEPVIGNSYYLAANVNGTLQYFDYGSKTTDIIPYALHVTEDAAASQQVTLEDYTAVTSTAVADKGFQMTWPNPDTTSTNPILRIYCYNAETTNSAMDTGHNGKNTAAGHTFFVDEVDGVKVLRKYSNNNILVVKYNDAKGAWRMLGVPEAELANEGVYPAMLLEEHAHEAGKEIAKSDDNNHSYSCWCGAVATTEAHTFGKPTHNQTTKTTIRACTVCGYVSAAHGHSQVQVKHPTIGESYYLSANVNGTLRYFYVSGSVAATNPYSLNTSDDIANAKPVTLAEAVSAGKGEFQLDYDNNGTESHIYCFDALSSGANKGIMDTGTGTKYKDGNYGSNYTATRATFSMDVVDGTTVLRKYSNNNVLVVKELTHTDGTTKTYRMLGVPESELGTAGVYPVMLTVAHTEHIEDDNTWYFDEEAGTQSHLCSVCGAPRDTMYGTDVKGTLVTEPVIGNGYYLAANVGGTLQFFYQSGSTTNTIPYSLYVTDDAAKAQLLTLEDYTAVTSTAVADKGFQMTWPNPNTSSASKTLRIYCYNAETTNSAMDTGHNGSNTANGHTFFVDEVDGVKVLRKYSNNNILVVKYNQDKEQWRMLGVPESELANEGVYPAMLMNIHEHVFNGEELHSDDHAHYHLCECGSKAETPHSFGQWTLDRAAQTQTATCSVCERTVTVASPYFDTVDSLEELTNGLAEISKDEETNTYIVSGGNDYYLTAEKDGVKFYFRNVDKTAAGNSEGTSSTVTETTGHSLYMTDDVNHNKVIKAKVIPGSTEDTYIIYAGKDINRAVYIRNEKVGAEADENVDTGLTAFNGNSTNATYKARAEFMWDEADGRMYQVEGDEKYVLVMKQMTATYNSTETLTEWRMVGVPEAEATAAGNYPVVLERHVHNLSMAFTADDGTYYRACGCGYKATVSGSVTLGDSIAVNFQLKLEEGETVTMTVGGKEVPVELTAKGFGIYTASAKVAAAQMTDEIRISVGGEALDVPFTVKAAADAVKADPNSTQNAKDLVDHMLAYGAAAQNYFGYNTENLAGSEMAVTMPTENEVVEVVNGLPGINFYGASMLHKDRTVIRFYFIAETVEGLTFTVDGNVVEAAQKDGMYYIDAAGVNPLNLDQELNVVVSNGEEHLAVCYSPVNYIIRTYNKANTSAEQKALVKAMYGYHTAAKTYIANKYLKNGFDLVSQSKTTLYAGVEQYSSRYMNADANQVKAYTIVVKADANVELKVSAGAWSANSTAQNPGETKTVFNHFLAMDRKEEVLAMINGGFFDRTNNKTMKPYGMQIVDGVVKQAPSAGNYSDNWFGMTKDGKYVISNTEGYNTTYINNVQQGIGGGKLLMIDGVVQDIDSGRDYRTAVGVNAAGDLALVAVEDATYSDVNQIFRDLGMDITTVLNLDGGGSTAMYVPGSFIPKALILGDYRNVPDAVGIVVK